MKMALLVIDMQKAFYGGYDKESMDQAAPRINDAVALFRKKNYPVVWIQNEDERVLPGSSGFDMIEALTKPIEGEKRIVKRYSNSFNKTDLPDYLTAEKIDTLLITGYNALYCILSSYRGAEDRDLSPVLLRGASASNTKENVTLVEDICDIISFNVLEKLLAAAI
ncbi:isochorismatase [Spirochaetia bacterium]|nr:isochorismatase [Spirochaetia bacterium]